MVNQDAYLAMLEDFAFPESARMEDDVIFQHDGAPPHWGLLLDQRFPGQWIGRGGPTPWPARSPDMTPLDFYF